MPQQSSSAVSRQSGIEFVNNAGLTAIVWIGLFEANAYVAEVLVVNDYVSWVFLPAAIRVLSVLLAGYAGVFGLFVGALFTNMPIDSVNLIDAVALSVISAVSPMIAVGLLCKGFSLSKSLAGLRWWHLIAFAVVGAVCNVTATQLYFAYNNHPASVGGSWLPMLVGDLIGAFVFLYTASLLTKFAAKLR